MTKKWIMLASAFLFTTAFLTGAARFAAEDAPISISEVMKEAMKGGLNKKVASGEASAEEKDRLLVLFKGLAENEPPEGDLESWKAKTEALVNAAEAAVKGADDAPAMLKSAANCKACHDAHRP
ncbi:hypothetical protein [Tautonia rosea]|uniref:hypothetical protein n=1 Tax=Tautonia rosea TaxID=2728037 RepID=UPI0014731254|nr:hypothetical protein [Tautonia rosea]